VYKEPAMLNSLLQRTARKGGDGVGRSDSQGIKQTMEKEES